MPTFDERLPALAAWLSSRRDAILESWRLATLADSRQETAGTLTRGQFEDHIPNILDALEKALRTRAGSEAHEKAEREIIREEAKHGLQRWQQGYKLEEVLREWGHLHLCLAGEFARYASENPGWPPEEQWAASRALIEVINEGVAESAAQHARLDRTEAAGRANDLEQAVHRLRELEARRRELIHQAVHDLRGNVQSVTNVAELLADADGAAEERAESATALKQAVEAVGSMLSDLLDLARLEAGLEDRTVAPFDAARLLNDLCRAARPRAGARGLFLVAEGPESLHVQGDSRKVHRLVQNLLFNALNYTQNGGVNVGWGSEGEKWWVLVKDTGPGLLGGPGAPLAMGMRDATASAREADVPAAAEAGRTPRVLDQHDAGSTKASPARQQPGEGIGLAIVKRLAELLDASIELISSSESGTTLRVIFPRRYPL